MKAWPLFLAVPLLAYRPPSIGGLSVDLTSLLVPLAALLGSRYGKAGPITVALAGALFVPSIATPFGAFGGALNVYLIALVAAAMTARRVPLLELARSCVSERAAVLLTFLTPLAMELYLGTSRLPLTEHDVTVSLSLNLYLVGYFVVFLMGMRGVRLRVLLLGLLVAAALTWSLFWSGTLKRPTGMVHGGVSLFDLGTALALPATLLAGKAAAACLRGQAVGTIWAWPYLTAAALLLLWYGPQSIDAFTFGQLSARSQYFYHGVSAALPVAAFMTGLLRGRTGMIFTTVAVIVLAVVCALYGLIAEESVRLMLEGPFVAAAYGALGKAMTARASDVQAKPRRIPALLAIVLSVVATVLGDASAPRLILASVLLAAMLAIAVAVFRLRDESIAAALQQARDQLLRFVALVMVASVLSAYLLDLAAAAASLYEFVSSDWQRGDSFGSFGSFDDDALLELSSIVLIYLAALIGTAIGFVRAAPKAWKAAGEVLRLLKPWWQRRPANTRA